MQFGFGGYVGNFIFLKCLILCQIFLAWLPDLFLKSVAYCESVTLHKDAWNVVGFQFQEISIPVFIQRIPTERLKIVSEVRHTFIIKNRYFVTLVCLANDTTTSYTVNIFRRRKLPTFGKCLYENDPSFSFIATTSALKKII